MHSFWTYWIIYTAHGNSVMRDCGMGLGLVGIYSFTTCIKEKKFTHALYRNKIYVLDTLCVPGTL